MSIGPGTIRIFGVSCGVPVKTEEWFPGSYTEYKYMLLLNPIRGGGIYVFQDFPDFV